MQRHLLFGAVTALSHFAFAQVSVELELVQGGLTNPTDVANCGDDRLFIVERAGVIRILDADGVLLPTPYLDISGPVHSGGSEQGLLGMAFHPQYAQNGFFYLYYCSGTGNGSVRVSRFTVSSDLNVANAASEVVLWELAQPYTNHKGGGIAFGPDGYLYFAPGDGGSSGDPENRAQNMSLGFGKVHRINVNGASPYTIPSTNPFATANNTDTLRSIFASGLRNPYRFSFDEVNGDLWIGDVGQSTREEVDRIAGGTINGPNFGWRCYEGNAAYNTAGCQGSGSYIAPIVDHDQSGGWCSVIAGRVYRGTRYPNLAGRFLHTDYCLGGVRSLHKQGGIWIQETLSDTSIFGFSGFGKDVSGELYMVNTETGEIQRVIDPDAVVRVSPKVNLEGPYNTGTGLMHDALRTASLIPLTEPYTALGYPQVARGGGETVAQSVLSITGNNAVVDWVRVELRPAAQPTLIAATRQGLLQRDGDVVSASGSGPLSFTVGSGNYYVVVRHRNHLGAMTAAPVSLSTTTSVVDFLSSSTLTYGTNARRVVGSTLALWAGNTTGNDRLQYTGTGNDRDPILTAIGGTLPTNTVTGYRSEDVTMDGVTKYTGPTNDRDPILVNVGGTVPTAVRIEQLP
ncbi:MAG: PQQ-dependent sugar dehydrogenase [Flavobacteriales bacterium]